MVEEEKTYHTIRIHPNSMGQEIANRQWKHLFKLVDQHFHQYVRFLNSVFIQC